jgi:hypothetical protein
MEPLSALSIAAAGVQFVDFVHTLFSETREIYKSSTGQTERVSPLTRVTKDLDSLTSRVEEKAGTLRDSAPPESAEAMFLDSCKRCKEVSKELSNILGTLCARPSPRFSIKSARSSVAAGIRGMLSGDKISNLFEELCTIEQQMHLAGLVFLWEKAKENGETTVQVSQRLLDMASTLERVDATATKLAAYFVEATKGHTEQMGSAQRSEMMRSLWETNWTPRPSHVPRLYSSWTDADAELVREGIVVSLGFGSMHDRQETIPKAYADTFEWLFRTQPVPGRSTPWASFPSWLEADTLELYWITGKPGAGKSTLMKFLTADPRLTQHLAAWAGSNELLRASFYLWNAGTGLQKSHTGLMRALLFQCLSQRPELTCHVCPRRWAALQMLGIGAADELPDWDWEELVDCFKALVSQAENGYRIALFIDGLDEFDGDHTKLVETVKDLSQWKGVKICVSSRPWNVFTDAFRQSPSLLVQDLTKNDIQRYVRGHLEAQPGFGELQAMDPDNAEKLMQDIVSRADGVFLWVAVVVRKLSACLTDGDKLSDLFATLHKLPRDLENLFEAIRRQIDPKHAAQSSQYFLLLLEPRRRPCIDSLSAITFLLADEDETSPVHRDYAQFCDAKQSWVLATMGRRLHSRSMGLLEISPSGTVEFLHRTVLEWVTREENLAAIKRDAPAGFNPSLELCKARTTELLNFHVDPQCTALPRTDEPAQVDANTKNAARLWRSLMLCLRHAALATGQHEKGDARVVQMLESLEVQLPGLINSKGSAFTLASNMILNPVEVGDDISIWGVLRSLYKDLHLDLATFRPPFLRLAAQFGILPVVEARVSRRALREQYAPLDRLLYDVVFGHWRVVRARKSEKAKRMGITALVPSLRTSRVELVKHLLRVAPHNRTKWRACESMHSRIGRTVDCPDPELLDDVAGLLDRELRAPVWVWRYFAGGPNAKAETRYVGSEGSLSSPQEDEYDIEDPGI